MTHHALPQTGIDIKAYNNNGSPVWTVQAWYCFYWPGHADNSERIINYDVKSGNEMYVELAITDSSGNPNPGSNWAKYFMTANTDPGIQPIMEPLNYNPPGTFAEWIVERPLQFGGTLFNEFPQFTDVDIFACGAQDNSQHPTHCPCDLDTMNDVVMVDYPATDPTPANTLSVISEMWSTDPSKFTVSWRNFGTPGPVR